LLTEELKDQIVNQNARMTLLFEKKTEWSTDGESCWGVGRVDEETKTETTHFVLYSQ